MKMHLIALAAVAAMSAAAPAYASYVKTAPRSDTERQQTFVPMSASGNAHCQQVLSRPDMWGSKEVEYCQNSVL